MGGGRLPPPPSERFARSRRLDVTEGKLDLPGPSGPVRIPDRRVIAQARVPFEVRLDNARPDGMGRDDRRWGCALRALQ